MKHIHCCPLQGITVDEKRIGAINSLADKLISQGRTDTSAVKERRDAMNQKYVFAFNMIYIIAYKIHLFKY